MTGLLILLFPFVVFFQITENRILTQEDYTLYFDEYRFDWSNSEHWKVITTDNTQRSDNGKLYTKIVACTLNLHQRIKGLKKNLCVHTKSKGGFTLKFQDSPQEDSMWNDVRLPTAAHINIDNTFEDDDIYDIELDFLNDDDWDEINAIWNWNPSQNTDTHRRLIDDEEEEEFLFGKKNHNNNNNNNNNNQNNNNGQQKRPGFFGRLFGGNNNNNQQGMQPPMMGGYGMNPYMTGGMGMNPMKGGMGGMGMNPMMGGMGMRPMMGGYQGMGQGMMSPMGRTMMKLMEMKMYMKMMRHMMPRRHHDDSCCDSAESTQYGDDYNEYQALYTDIDHDTLYKRRLYDEEHNYYPDHGLHTGTGMGLGNMPRTLQKVPNMMMNMFMMKMLGRTMKQMNPYMAMLMLSRMNKHHTTSATTASQCANSCTPMSACNCHPMAMFGHNHLPMSCPGCTLGNQFMMNPMHLGMPGMVGMNPAMLGMMSGAMNGGLSNVDPMMLGLMGGMMAHEHPHPHPHPHHIHLPHSMHGLLKTARHTLYGLPSHHNLNLMGAAPNLAHHAQQINPLFNANMAYMMGRAVKKCSSLRNGLVLCAMYNPMTNQLNVDVKAKHGKRLKQGIPKRLFPKKLSRMIKMLVKQRVFGHAGDELLGGELEKRFQRGVGLKLKQGAKEAKEVEGGEEDKGKGEAGPPPDQDAGFGSERTPGAMAAPVWLTHDDGLGMEGMDHMERDEDTNDNTVHTHHTRRILMEGDDVDEELVQFDTMEGNIGYGIWSAEHMDWHNFKDLGDAKDVSDEFMDYGEYNNFGNFVHYFDRLEFDWNDDDGWDDVDGVYTKTAIQFGNDEIPMVMGQKCGDKLPFLDFKLCTKVTDDDITVFFKRIDSDIAAAKSDYFDENAYDLYTAVDDEIFELDSGYEWNDVKTLQDIIDYEFEHSLFRFSDEDDWHDITTSYSASHDHNNRRHLMHGQRVSVGGIWDEAQTKDTVIKLFGHCYRLRGIQKCGGNTDNPWFCVHVRLGQAVTFPNSVQLPSTRMCSYMYVAKLCLVFDPNRMELKLSIQFQSVHKWKHIATHVLDIIKQIPHTLKQDHHVAKIRWASRREYDNENMDQLEYDNVDDNEGEIVMYDDDEVFDDYMDSVHRFEHVLDGRIDDDAADSDDDDNKEQGEASLALDIFDLDFDGLVDINSSLFWFFNALAVCFGVLLCWVMSYYLKKRQEFIKEFTKQFDPFVISSEYKQKPLKYGFTPINVPLNHWDSDDDDDDEEDNHSDQ